MDPKFSSTIIKWPSNTKGISLRSRATKYVCNFSICEWHWKWNKTINTVVTRWHESNRLALKFIFCYFTLMGARTDIQIGTYSSKRMKKKQCNYIHSWPTTAIRTLKLLTQFKRPVDVITLLQTTSKTNWFLENTRI